MFFYDIEHLWQNPSFILKTGFHLNFIFNHTFMPDNKLLKTALILFLIICSVTILYYGRTFLLPVAFGGLFAMLFTPLSLRLIKAGIPQWAAISICMLILLLSFGLLAGVATFQVNEFIQDWSNIEKKLEQGQAGLEDYLVNKWGITTEERIAEMRENIADELSTFQSWMADFFGSFLTGVTGSFLVLAYMVFFMLSRKRITAFILKWYPEDKKDEAENLAYDLRQVASEYFIGRLILILILAVFYAIGFLIFGLQYAIPVAIFAAVMSIIPYIGNIIGGMIAIAIALATGGGPTVILGVVGTMSVAQVLENNVLEPWIVGSKVSLNPLFTILLLIGFSIIWGVAGTILAIPIGGILKVIFDHTESLQPLGFVMGVDDLDEGDIEK